MERCHESAQVASATCNVGYECYQNWCIQAAQVECTHWSRDPVLPNICRALKDLTDGFWHHVTRVAVPEVLGRSWLFRLTLGASQYDSALHLLRILTRSSILTRCGAIVALLSPGGCNSNALSMYAPGESSSQLKLYCRVLPARNDSQMTQLNTSIVQKSYLSSDAGYRAQATRMSRPALAQFCHDTSGYTDPVWSRTPMI
jgi:hypothetical protein